jgi:D-serine/D-alanine/glycine transporter
VPFGTLFCWLGLAFFIFVIVLLTLEPDTRIALEVTPIWFILLVIGYFFSATHARSQKAAEKK